MSDTTETIVDTYIDMWNEEHPELRQRYIETAWASDGTYVDPLLEAAGHQALDAMVVGVHGQYPGYRFRRTTAVDVHHDRARFGWELFGPEGDVLVAGVDVATLGPDGRLAAVTGFFGPLADAGQAA